MILRPFILATALTWSAIGMPGSADEAAMDAALPEVEAPEAFEIECWCVIYCMNRNRESCKVAVETTTISFERTNLRERGSSGDYRVMRDGQTHDGLGLSMSGEFIRFSWSEGEEHHTVIYSSDMPEALKVSWLATGRYDDQGRGHLGARCRQIK